LRREREAARAQVRESLASYEAGRIAISAEVADAYWALRGAQAQAAALSQLIALAQAKAGFVAARVHVGDLASEVSPRATAAVENLSAQRPAFDALVETQRNRIAVLLGRDPSASFAEFLAEAPIPDAPEPAARQPSDILRRRPDVLAAENRLIAANARIGITLAEYYPRVTLSSLVGQVTNQPAFLTSNGSNFAQGAVGLRWRLFDFVRIDADLRVAHGREREARAAYRQAVLLAAESVETSFAKLAAARARLTRLVAERVALANALAADGRALEVGEISHEAFVTSEQSVVQIDLDLATAREDVMRATVACERAMGGSTGQNDVADRLPSAKPGPASRVAQ
jgi:outer membrane protein TolC